MKLRHPLLPISSKITMLIMGGLLSGCGSLIPMPAENVKRFILESIPPSAGSPQTQRGHQKNQIVIDHPVVFSPLDNNRIAVKPSTNEIDYYADVEWGERLGGLIQESLVYSLQNTSSFTAVSRASEGISPDYNLKIDVRQFYIDRSQKTLTAKIEFFIQLTKSLDREVIGHHVIIKEMGLKNETIPAVIDSLNRLHLAVTQDLITWLQQQVNR